MPNTLINFGALFQNLSKDRLAEFIDQWYPPKPTFTEANVPRQDGRVFIVTGGNSGIGLALVKLLYPTGAKIYLACRSEERANAAIQEVTDEYESREGDEAPSRSPGSITYMHLDLDDLTTIKASAAFFAQRESQLDILWNNAGIAGSPLGSKTKQNLEAHMGVNCIGPLLFTQELLPQLRAAAAAASSAAASSSPGTTRVIWTGSLIINKFAPPPSGVDLAALDQIHAAGSGSQEASRDYGASKAGNWLLGAEGAARWGQETSAGQGDAIVSVCQNPGMIATPVWRHQPGWMMAFMNMTLASPRMGAYTMLYAGLSPEVGLDNNGAYILPFGRIMTKYTGYADIPGAIKQGKAKEFWEWCERAYTPYV